AGGAVARRRRTLGLARLVTVRPDAGRAAERCRVQRSGRTTGYDPGDKAMTLELPITMADVEAARARIPPYLQPTPLRRYAALDASVGDGIAVLVKHENHLPTNSFKVRNGVSAITALNDEQRRRGVVCGSRGNHGQGVAFASQLLGVAATVVVPHGNNHE